MQLFPSRSGLIGVQCADGMVRAGMLEKKGKTKKFAVLCEQEMSLRSLSAEGDAWLPKESSQILSDQLTARRIPRGHPCVLLLEPDKVFSSVVTIPRLPEKLEQLIRTEAEKFVPEAFDALTVRSAVLSTEGEQMRVGISAVRTDTLQHAMQIAQQAGLRPVSLTTAAASLARFLPEDKTKETVLLAFIPERKESKGTLTVLHKGWILDEQVILGGTADEEIVAMARALVEEHEGSATPIRHVFCAGNPVTEKALRDAFLVPPPTPSGGVGTPIPFDPILLPAQLPQPGWEDLTAACLLPPKRHTPNFVLQISKKESNKNLAMMGLAGGLMLVMFGMFYWIYRSLFAPPPNLDMGPGVAVTSSVPAETCRTAAGAAASMQFSLVDPAQITRFRTLCASDPVTVLPLPLCTVFPTQFLDSAPCTLPSHAAEQLLRASIVTMPADKRYNGTGPVNRAEALKLLLQTCPATSSSQTVAPSAEFADVSPADWFAPYIPQAVSRGIIAENGGGNFRPSDGVTRAEFVKMLSSACSIGVPAGTERLPYSDVFASDWYEPYARIANALTLFPQDPVAAEPTTLFAASRPMTRNDAAIALFHYLFAKQQNLLPKPGSSTASAAASPRPAASPAPAAASAPAASSSARASSVAAAAASSPAPVASSVPASSRVAVASSVAPDPDPPASAAPVSARPPRSRALRSSTATDE